MESLRVKNNDIYEIEVNDQGDTITFYLTDIELPLKIEKMYQMISEIGQDMKKEVEVTEEGGTGVIDAKKLAENRQVAEAFKKMRAATDEVLGEGACQKIFGDINYLTMFDDLFEALEPHLTKMNLQTANINKRIMEKYKKEDEEVV